MIVSNNKKFAFFHIQKTGGSALTLSLARYIDNIEEVIPNKLVTYNNAEVRGWQHKYHMNGIQHHKVSMFEVPNNFFTFAFVRNPFTRIASHFISLKPKYKTITELIANDPLPTMSSLLDKPLSFIGKHEQWEKDINYIRTNLNIKIDPNIIANKNKDYDWRQLYSTADKKAVHNYYIEDFGRFYNEKY